MHIEIRLFLIENLHERLPSFIKKKEKKKRITIVTMIDHYFTRFL